MMRKVVAWYFARALNVYLMRCGTCVTVFCGRGMVRMRKRFKCVASPYRTAERIYCIRACVDVHVGAIPAKKK